jgi:hypothetical protein
MSTGKIKVAWSKPVGFLVETETQIPEKSGVYEILEPMQTGDKRELYRRYVGRADNLRKRFNEHLNASEQNQCIKKLAASKTAKFDYAIIEREHDRMDAERALYDKYKTGLSCNDMRPSGSGRSPAPDIEEVNP